MRTIPCMNLGSKTVAIAVLFAASAALILIGVSASTHAAPAVPSQHAGAAAGSSAVAPSYTYVLPSNSYGVCQKCIYAHSYDASVLGMG